MVKAHTLYIMYSPIVLTAPLISSNLKLLISKKIQSLVLPDSVLATDIRGVNKFNPYITDGLISMKVVKIALKVVKIALKVVKIAMKEVKMCNESNKNCNESSKNI